MIADTMYVSTSQDAIGKLSDTWGWFYAGSNHSSGYKFQRLLLTRSSSYAEFSEWKALYKAVMNPKINDEQCFKWAVIASLRHKEIDKVLRAYQS